MANTEQDVMQQDEGKIPADSERGEPTRARPTFRPFVDIYETDNALVLAADIPGATPDGIEVNLERRELALRAAVPDQTPADRTPMHLEYQTGDYERRFQLTGDFDTEAISAEYRNGVLTLTIPKAARAEARRIDIRA